MSVHWDPRLTWGHVITTVGVVFALGGAWVQLEELGLRLERVATAVQESTGRMSDIERRTAVLETQRIADDRRLNEIRETVLDIRQLLEERRRE